MSDQTLRERYRARPSRWGAVFLAIGAVLLVGLAAWLVWVIAIKVNPAVTSSLSQWEVVDEHTVSATVTVHLDEGATDPSCLLRATAEDHTTVGELPFTPVDGSNEITVRTERRATSLESVGCTAHGQNDPR
ncbi:MAG: DUF4307 domain-containing protein [Nocardioides sp.]|uniref:DUF4307 domain-containing protein n=1 Tax=Nocardioides sp. TaxID=35761 RepID=UPI0039E57F86